MLNKSPRLVYLQKFVIEVYYWKLIKIIKSALSELAAEHFHLRHSENQVWMNHPNEFTQNSTLVTFGTRNMTRLEAPTKMDPTTLLRHSLLP